LQFFYHPDHLGSSNYITDVSGEVYQHLEYFPSGETFVHQKWSSDYTSVEVKRFLLFDTLNIKKAAARKGYLFWVCQKLIIEILIASVIINNPDIL